MNDTRDDRAGMPGGPVFRHDLDGLRWGRNISFVASRSPAGYKSLQISVTVLQISVTNKCYSVTNIRVTMIARHLYKIKSNNSFHGKNINKLSEKVPITARKRERKKHKFSHLRKG